MFKRILHPILPLLDSTEGSSRQEGQPSATRNSSRGYQRGGTSCYRRLHFLFYYGIWQGAGPTLRASSLPPFFCHITSHLINTFPPLLEEGVRRLFSSMVGMAARGLRAGRRWERWKARAWKRKALRHKRDARARNVEGGTAKPVESRRTHVGNQECSQPVSAVFMCVLCLRPLFLAQLETHHKTQ